MNKHDELLGRWAATQDRMIVRRMRWQFAIAIGVPVAAILASIIIKWITQ